LFISPISDLLVGAPRTLFQWTSDLGVVSFVRSLTRSTSAQPLDANQPSSTTEIPGEGQFQTPRDPEGKQRQAVSKRRIGKLAELLAEALDQSSEWQARIREAAPLHDLGKLWVPDEILDKPGPLTDEEFETVKKHTLVGEALLSGRGSDAMQMAGRIARSHHERWNGEGYPDGLEGEDIPLSARIVAAADAFDAMTHDQPYRAALPVEKAFSVIEDGAGAQFDPRVSVAALRRREEMAALV
jgi:HD-GYP domain-containing protein (c-di-GMP phosphodiesterase class II)